MQKGITVVVTVILLLLITIAIIGFAFMFFTRTVQTATGTTEQELGSTLQQLSYSFVIENVDYVSNIVTLRNTGTGALSNLQVYVDGNAASVTYSPVQPNTIGDLFFVDALEEGEHSLRITTGGMEQIITISVPSQYSFDNFTIEGF